MPRRRKNGVDPLADGDAIRRGMEEAGINVIDVEDGPHEHMEEHNAQARFAIIRETCETIAEFDRQIDGIKAERKAVIETRIVADLGMKKQHFATAYKLYQMDQSDRDSLEDTIRECFRALGVGGQLNWLDAAEVAGATTA